MEWFKVNKKLFPVKAHFFLLNGAHSGVITFVPVYAQQLGISPGAIGVILAVLSFLTFISRAAFGGLADHFKKLKQLLLFLLIIDVAADLGLNFIPKPYQQPLNSTSEFFCHQGDAYFIDNKKPDCDSNLNNFTTNCDLLCSLCEIKSSFCFSSSDSTASYGGIANLSYSNDILDPSSNNMKCRYSSKTVCTASCFDGSETCRDVTGTNPPLQLWLIAVCACIIYLANGSIVSLSDAACFNALGDKPQNYGKQRMWGTIGWGIFALLSGYLNQVFTGSSKVYSYSAGFYNLIVLFAIDLIFITKLHLKNTTLSKNICKDVGSVLVKPRILLFILGMFGIGILTGITRAYLYLYLRTTLGASQLVLGCVSAVQCFLGELPFFFFSGLIISKIGHINTFTMSFIAFGLKFLAHSFIMNPWFALPIELLQGPCFGSFYAAMTSYSKKISPEGTEATVQGIVSGAFEGLGVATGSLLVGFCMSSFGGRTTFYWTGLLSLAAGLLHYLVHLIIGCKKTDSENKLECRERNNPVS